MLPNAGLRMAARDRGIRSLSLNIKEISAFIFFKSNLQKMAREQLKYYQGQEKYLVLIFPGFQIFLVFMDH